MTRMGVQPSSNTLSKVLALFLFVVEFASLPSLFPVVYCSFLIFPNISNFLSLTVVVLVVVL